MARRAAVIEEERNAAEYVLVVDAGNSLLYDAEPAVQTKGASSIAAMNEQAYDALALGLVDLKMLTPDELRRRISEAQFPVLSANATLVETGDLIASPWILVTRGDLRIGILGLTGAGLTTDFEAKDPLAAAQHWVPKMQQEADMIVLLSHACLMTDKAIAAAVPGIDLIVSGCSTGLSEPYIDETNQTVIIHADYAQEGSAGERIGIAHLQLAKTGEVMEIDWRLLHLDNEYPDDPEMAAWLADYLETLK